MRIIRRLLFKEVLAAVALVCAGFLLLFAFFDLVEELREVGASGYSMGQALLYVLALAPGHLYDLLPIGLLIACVWVLSRFALNSEFTIMRTSGLGPTRVLGTLLSIGVLFSALTFALGDYIAPASNSLAAWIKNESSASGAWLRDRHEDGNYIVHVGRIEANQNMHEIQIMAFAADGRLVQRVDAADGRIAAGQWLLQKAVISNYPQDLQAAVERQSRESYSWATQITAEMVNTALIKPDRMGTLDLYRYAQHLKKNQQNAHTYEIALWRKLLYPLGCLVMVMLALPFAYLHHRNTGAATYVFIGVMVGIAFYLFNNVSNHIGNLQGWMPWLAAALPSMVFGVAALGIFTWLVLRR